MMSRSGRSSYIIGLVKVLVAEAAELAVEVVAVVTALVEVEVAVVGVHGRH
jgi:hypothetical protein